MSVLVEGFTLVLIAQAIEDCYRGGIESFLDEMGDDSFACDGHFVRLGCRGRDHLRERLAHLAERGMPDAADLLRATATSGRDLTPEESAELDAIHAGTSSLALVYRKQTHCPPWLEVATGPAPGGGPVVAGCFAAGEEPGALAVPEGWSPEQVVALRDEPEAGDERRPSWHEYLSHLRPDSRAWAMQTGPEGVLSLMLGLGYGKPFAGPIRPAPNVIERERVVRDPDGTEHTVVERWTKL